MGDSWGKSHGHRRLAHRVRCVSTMCQVSPQRTAKSPPQVLQASVSPARRLMLISNGAALCTTALVLIDFFDESFTRDTSCWKVVTTACSRRRKGDGGTRGGDGERKRNRTERKTGAIVISRESQDLTQCWNDCAASIVITDVVTALTQ